MSKLWFGNRLYIYIVNPEEAKTILQSQFCLNKTDAMGFISDVFGDGLVTSKGIAYITVYIIFLNLTYSWC